MRFHFFSKHVISTLFLLLPAILFTPFVMAQNTKITSFLQSKKFLQKIYEEHAITLYCGCSFQDKTPHFSECGYVPKKNTARAHRIEWEHVVPAHTFGHSLREWKDGHSQCRNKRGTPFKGRKCATKTNHIFQQMQADMYNLYPAIGEVNGRRSNYPMGIISGEARQFGACDVEISRRTVEPRPEIRGDIARTYLYMDAVYPNKGIITHKNFSLFQTWSENDPVDTWECTRAEAIYRIQGNRNNIVTNACLNRYN